MEPAEDPAATCHARYGSDMELMCLGPLEARDNGLPLELGEPKRRLVLALLVMHAGSVVSTDRLIDGVWGDQPPENARKIVQGYISGLRKTLGDRNVIELVSPGYRLNVKRSDVDAYRFEIQAAEGAAAIADDPAEARVILAAALGLWRGSPYQDLADHDALRSEIIRLELLRDAAVEARIEAEILSGNTAGVVAELADLTTRFPLRERLWSLRMLALYRSGRQAEALRVAEQARSTLAAEVGLEPSAELRMLEQRIFEQAPILDTAAALHSESAVLTASERNPYKGLRAFEETDADDFYGREGLVRRIRESMERRTEHRLVVLAGPSGSGKSSVVAAGLVPSLRTKGWSIATMYPGGSPIEPLSAAVEAIKPKATGTDQRRLLIVDQLEELVTLVSDETCEAFLDDLADLASSPDGPWVVVTVRADFLDPLLLHLRFAPLVEPGLVLVTPLEDHEVRDVIVGPASRTGVVVEPDLVAAMVRDVGRRAAALPLLEYALTDLYDRAGGGVLTLDGLEAAGGISGALAKRAEEIYTGLDDVARESARHCFLRLVALTDEGEPLRQRVVVDSLEGLEGISAVLAVFGEHRLLTFDRDHDGHRTVEVAHEALLREWPRLAQWVDQAVGSLRMLRQLTIAATEWEGNERADNYLLSGARLARYADWSEDHLVLSGTEREFLDESRNRRDRERLKQRKRRNAVLGGFAAAAVAGILLAVVALVARNDAATNAEVAEQNEALATARELSASAVAVVGEDPELSVLLALEAINSAPQGTAGSGSGVLALREALSNHRLLSRYPGEFSDVKISPDASTIYLSSLSDRSVSAIDAETGDVRWEYHDAESVDLIAEFLPIRILELSLSRDGQLLSVSIPDLPTSTATIDIDSGPARVVILDTDDGTVETTLVFDECRLSNTYGSGFTADGNWLAINTGDANCFDGFEHGWISLFDPVTWEEASQIRIEGFYAQSVTFNTTGTNVLVHDFTENVGELRTFPDLELINRLPDREVYPGLAPTGSEVVLGSPETDRRGLLVHGLTGDRIGYLDVVDFWTGGSPRFSPSGRVVGIATRTHDLVFDVGSGILRVDLGNNGTTEAFDFNGDDTRLVTVSLGDAALWDIGDRASVAGTPVVVPGQVVAWMNPNMVVGSTDVAVGVIVDDGPFDQLDATVTVVLDPATGETLSHMVGDSVQLPDGRFVVASRSLGTEDRTLGPLVVFDPVSGSSVELDGCVAPSAPLLDAGDIDCSEPFFSFFAFDEHHLITSVDGTLFGATSYAPSGGERTVRIWDSETLEVRTEFTVAYQELAFAIGDVWIAVIDVAEFAGGTERWITVYDIETGATIAELAVPGSTPFPQVANVLANDGSMMFMSDGDGESIVAIDTGTWERVGRWHAHDALIRGFAVSPDGRRLVTTGQDNMVKVWNISSLLADGSMEGPPPLLDRVPAEFPSDAVWLSDDRLGVFLADGAEYIVVSLNVADLVDEAAARLTRSFTVEECAVYQIDPCPTLEDIRNR